MKEFIEEMIDVYMLDETDGEYLLEEIEVKMNEILSEPRYMKGLVGILSTLENVQWIKNNQMLEDIMGSHEMKSYSKSDVIQKSGEMPTEIKILHNGIVKIYGTNTGEKEAALPNTNSLYYFCVMGNFVTYLYAPQTLGLLGYLLQTPTVNQAESASDSKLISISFEKISQIEDEFGSLSFLMWRPIALQIAFAVLRDVQVYEKWSDEKIKIHLEEGIFPNLEGKFDFDVDSVIADIVLIQGKVMDKKTDVVYVGPAYIPHSAKDLQILDDLESRPRTVMVLLREEKFHARSVLKWLEINEIKHIGLGLCLVHGIKKNSSRQQINENFGQQKSFRQIVRRFLKPKSEHLLHPL